MDNREVTLPNLSILETNRELVYPVVEKTIKIIDQDSSQSDKNDNPNEIMMNAKKIFVERFENASVEQKQDSVTQFYNALNSVYKATYRGTSIPIKFWRGEGYAFNHDSGFIRIPLDELEKQTSDKAAFSILHEYRHAMQPSLNIESSNGINAFTKLSHDMCVGEIDATKFAFENMDNLGLDKTKIDRYDDWQKAIRITDTFDLLKQNYNQETADNMLSIYKLLDEYTFQTTRFDLASDVIREKFNKIRAKIRFTSNITIAKAKFTEIEKVAKLTNDSFLLKVASEVRTDWSQFHL